MRAIASVAQAVFYLAYPFVVYFAYTRLETRGVAGLLFVLYAISILMRARGSWAELWQVARPHLGLVVLILVAVASDERLVLLLLPMAASLYLLWTFAWSLRRGPPMIERFARLVEDDLPAALRWVVHKVGGIDSIMKRCDLDGDDFVAYAEAARASHCLTDCWKQSTVMLFLN